MKIDIQIGPGTTLSVERDDEQVIRDIAAEHTAARFLSLVSGALYAAAEENVLWEAEQRRAFYEAADDVLQLVRKHCK